LNQKRFQAVAGAAWLVIARRFIVPCSGEHGIFKTEEERGQIKAGQRFDSSLLEFALRRQHERLIRVCFDPVWISSTLIRS
jgi:hypothetical protein